MKQFAQNYKTGELALLEVPIPACKSGGIVVRSDYSLISMGTEAMKIHESTVATAAPNSSQRGKGPAPKTRT